MRFSKFHLEDHVIPEDGEEDADHVDTENEESDNSEESEDPEGEEDADLVDPDVKNNLKILEVKMKILLIMSILTTKKLKITFSFLLLVLMKLLV